MAPAGQRYKNSSSTTRPLCVVASSLQIQRQEQRDVSSAVYPGTPHAEERRSRTSPRTPPLQSHTPDGGFHASRCITAPDPRGDAAGQPVLRSPMKSPLAGSSAFLDQSVGNVQGEAEAVRRAGGTPTPLGLQLRVHNDDTTVGCTGALRLEEGSCGELLRPASVERAMKRDTDDSGHACRQLEQEDVSDKAIVGCGQSMASGMETRKMASVLDAMASDVVVLICGYIEAQDIVRFSTVCPVLFDQRAWQQLYLVRYGRPNRGLVAGLPLARASRIQLESEFPIRHVRLTAIRHHHGLMLLSESPPSDYDPRLTFALETLRREDKALREDEIESQKYRARVRRWKNATRTSALRGLAAVKRASTEERMTLVNMRCAVERYAYPPGRRPHVPQPSSLRERHGGGGKALRAARTFSPSLPGVFRNG